MLAIHVLTEESSNSEEKAPRLPRMAIRSRPNITATTNTEDVLTEINAINLKWVTELSR